MTAGGLFSASKEWGEWLKEVFRLRETKLTTLTFASRPWEVMGTPSLSRVRRAASRYEKSLILSLDPVSYFIVLERGGWNGRMHLHSLTYSAGAVPIFDASLRHAEREGFVSVRSVDVSAEVYVTKYLSKSDNDFWLAGGPLFREQGEQGAFSGRVDGCCGVCGGVGDGAHGAGS